MEVRLAAALLLLAAAACGGPGAPEDRGRSAAPRPRAYAPPEDGRLTEGQVAKYLAFLQNRARFSPPEPDPEGDSGGDRDLAAALQIGVNPEEMRWVGQKVLDSRMQIEEREAARRNLETYRSTLAALRKAAAASSDPATRATVSRQIAELERESADLERSLRRPTEKVLASNQALVLRYRLELDTARGLLPVPK